ncbi:hypothetical protein Tco_0929465, partial [Tanacetum coccineum]
MSPRPKRLQESTTSRTRCTNASPGVVEQVLDEEQSCFYAGEQIQSTNEAGTSYYSNNPFEEQDHDTFTNISDSNIILYDQYVEDNEEHVVQCNASSVRNDALMSILDEMHEQGVQSRLANKPDMVMNDSVTSELARYKELSVEYEKRQ